MRLIDARALKEYMCSTIADIAEQPTVEAVSKERYREAVLKVLQDVANETGLMGRYDNADRALRVGANSGIFGRIERELFGGDSE